MQVTPEELRKYYEANKPAYQVPEKRNLGILMVDQAKLAQTIQPTDADLLRLYNDNKDTYRIPERVNVRHILLKTTDKDPKQDAAVKAKADELVKQLRAAGANFADLAKKYSEDPGSKDQGRRIRWGGARPDGPGIRQGRLLAQARRDQRPGEDRSSDITSSRCSRMSRPQLKPFDEVKAQLAAEYKKQRVERPDAADRGQGAGRADQGPAASRKSGCRSGRAICEGRQCRRPATLCRKWA